MAKQVIVACNAGVVIGDFLCLWEMTAVLPLMHVSSSQKTLVCGGLKKKVTFPLAAENLSLELWFPEYP